MFYIKLSSFKNNYKKILKSCFLGIFLFRRRNKNKKEKVLEIEFKEVWDMWAWQITKNKLKMEDNEFFIVNNTKLMLKVVHQIDEYIICIEDNYKNIGEFELITNEQKKCIENFVDLVNQKYGIIKRWRGEENEEYYYIGSGGIVWSVGELFCDEDNENYNLGNYFRTEEEAQKIIDSKEWQDFWEKVRAGEIGK